MSGLARPVRILASSRRSASCAFSMFDFRSSSVSAIIGESPRTIETEGKTGPWAGYSVIAHVGDEGSNVLAQHHPANVAASLQGEDADGKLVVPAERDRGRVHHADAIDD